MSYPNRIAVIGAGPKGLYCLERLAVELHRDSVFPPLEIHVFEPHPCPGAGPIYDPTQPDYLRMNFANGKIDMWPPNAEPNGGRSPLSGPTFVEHLAAIGIPGSAADYAPRRLVGSYLHEGFRRVVESLKAVASVNIHPESVISLNRQGIGFELRTAAQSLRCNEVLLATGHQSRNSPPSTGISPYPIDQPGGVCDIEPGSAVAVRGMGLTAIDVALALTEGRNGRFLATDTHGHLDYQPSGLEATKILPFSRTGRPMTPKPHPGLMPETAAIVAACNDGARLLDKDGSSGFDRVIDAMVKSGESLLQYATGADGCGALIRDHLEELLSRQPIGCDEIILEMRAGVEIAFGQRQPGPDWALGTAWRGIYPALVRLVAARALDDDWRSFSALATEMERVAFGPPAENAARLVALVDAGIVDLSCAADPTLTDSESGFRLISGSAAKQADVLVNAVIDPPGAAPHPSELVAALLTAGLARSTAHSPGLEVSADGTCIGVSGEPTVGLAAVGRPTEGSILGNDTLSRSLHDTPAMWAQTITCRLRQQMETSAA